MLFAFVAPRVALRLAIVPCVASITVGFLLALRLLALRGYASAPFLTSASAVSASVVLAAWLVVRVGAVEHIVPRDPSLRRPDLAVASSVLLAFVWGAVECGLAFNQDVATFLLVFYLAACGVASLGVGRARRIEALRQVGLAVAVRSALYALASVSGVQQIGYRVGSYLAVGAFLLGVAWWYRAEVASGP